MIPVSFSTALLLHTFGISINVTMFGKVSREVVISGGGSIS
jgi:hypothetical protein